MFIFVKPSHNPKRTDCGDSGDNFTEFELVENSGLTSGIKTDLYYPEFRYRSWATKK
jgi:hypothetical protein